MPRTPVARTSILIVSVGNGAARRMITRERNGMRGRALRILSG